LYRLDANLTVHAQLGGLTIPNGIVWSLDNTTMYYIDTPTQRVDAFDYDHATGDVGNRRVACEIPEAMGWPDGMSIDTRGNLWIGMWGGFAVTHWNPQTGEYLGKVKVPAGQTTACAFGGPDLDVLYITSARRGKTAPELAGEPHAGGVFKAEVGVAGVPANAFIG
jgi:sugar lactone lactonase YvrE